MNKVLISLLTLACLMTGGITHAAEKPHAVVVVGTHHYTPQMTMPKFASELERLGFRTTVINPDWNPEKDKRGLPGLEVLESADVAVFFMRFLKLEDQQLEHITDYVEAGKPVVSLRTSTHAFNYPKQHPKRALNLSFAREAFGSPYRIHLSGGTEIRPAEGAAGHAILTGVDTAGWKSPGTLYLTSPEPGITPLLLGTGKSKPGVRKNAFGTHKLEAEMTDTVAWTWTNKWGGRAFATSLGHVGDFAVPQSMRVMVNGVFWAAGAEVPAAGTEVKVFTSKAAPKKKTPPAVERQSAKSANSSTRKESLADTKMESDGLTVFYGNSFVERLQEEGSLEALLQAAYTGERRQYRSLAYTGDEVGFRIRPDKFGDHLAYLTSQMPCDRVVMCFGMNEAFAGSEGVADFSKNLETYLTIIKSRHPKSALFLVSPTAVEDLGTSAFPDAIQRNADVALYAKVMQESAEKNEITYIDLFTPSKNLYENSKLPLTSNGLHLNEDGNQAIAQVLASSLASSEKVAAVDTEAPGFASLRKLVSRKAYEVAMAYHPANGIHYYGVRGRPFEYATEIPHHLKLANTLDQSIWAQANNLQEKKPFPKLTTARAEPPPKPPRKGLGVIKTSAEDLADFKVADGFEVNLFASSEDFPELINPLQIRFDTRGRLWVACFESYPVPVPGTLSSDKILIFEDSDGDGIADKRTVFADHLKLPDGFVFYKDGIIVSVARKLVWLRDTNGDDVADLKEELLRGADDTDTHHSGYLARTPQGHVVYCEGLFHRGQFETPHGPLRTKDATAMYFNPDSQKLTIERQTTHPNPWKISWNRWGEAIQMFGGGQIIDCEYYNVSTPVGISSGSNLGMPFRDDKGCTLAFVSSAHFPDDWQGGLVTGHLLAKNAVLFTPLKIVDGTYVKAANSMELLSSPNKSFRPTDMEFGLDGALYVSDFYYPIVGHAQHSIRDANRDYTNGRIWRVTRKGAALAKPPVIDGASIAELFALLRHAQVGVRELARQELERRPGNDVLAYAKAQVPVAKEDEEFGLELIWLFERAEDFTQKGLFRQLLASSDHNVQRAAARSIRWWAPALGDEAKEIATELMKSSDERTQIAILSVASFLQQGDPEWRELIEGVDISLEKPVGKVAAVAAQYLAPPLSPEFPLLKVAEDTQLSGWLINKTEDGGSLWLRSNEPQELILGYRNNPNMNLIVNTIPVLRAGGSQFAKQGQIGVSLKEGLNKIEFVSTRSRNKRKGAIDLYLSNLVGSKSDSLVFAKDEAEHRAWGEEYEAKFATVTESRIYLKTIPSQCSYNVSKFVVKAGRKYEFIFENPDHMMHNIVITKPGRASAVGELVDAMAAQPDAIAKHYVPDSDDVLFATPQLPYGEKVVQEFVTPEERGEYPFICTFPGHWRIMRGVMIVE